MPRARPTRPAWLSGCTASALALVVCLGLLPAAADAAYSDTIVLKNGDRIRGDVKNLQQGMLEFKTDTMSTVYIKWDRVAEITAPENFEVETTDGLRFYGTLASGGRGKLVIDIGLRTVTVNLVDVVRIRLLKRQFWDRLDGSVDLGASYAKSSGIGQGSLAFSLSARRPTFELGTKFDTTITVQPDQPVSSRTTLSGGYVRLLKNRWIVPVTAKAERNTDIGLELRASGTGGFGRYFVQTNRSQFGSAAGLVVTHEIPVDGEPSNNIEAYVGATYAFFTHDRPKTSVNLSVSLLPSLNVSGRYRTDFGISVKRELFKDFTVGFSYYDTYDNKPPGGGSPAHDFGGTVTVGWISDGAGAARAPRRPRPPPLPRLSGCRSWRGPRWPGRRRPADRRTSTS